VSEKCHLPDDLPLGALISIIFRTRSIILNQWLKPLGLSSGQYPVMLFLLNNQNITQETLVKVFHIDRGTIARTVKKLESAGYITRKPDPESRRAVRLFITKKAEEITQILIKMDADWEKIVTSSLEEMEQLHHKEVLHKIALASLHKINEPKETEYV
jgi:MarR family transcriptional regulator, temperature-dependent positive regulator of motility